MQSQPQLQLDGHDPGPLFGPLVIRRLSRCRQRSKAYKLKVRQATPPWVDLQAIRKLLADARFLTFKTGVPHTVDHVIPLKGENVCGLHVHTNMQILTRLENLKKGNSFADQSEFFDGIHLPL